MSIGYFNRKVKLLKGRTDHLKNVLCGVFPGMISLRSRFLNVYMDLNNKCNLRCSMCHFNLGVEDEPSVTMSPGLFERIAEEVFPRVRRVHLSCSAEPLLLPNLSEYLEVIQKYSVPHTKIGTNGLLLDREATLAITGAGISEISVSIDGATGKTYESIRKGSDFEKVMKNVELLQDIKRKSGRKTPLLILSYTLMRSNIHELTAFLRLAKKIGADRVRATHLIPFKGLDIMGESLVHYKKETNEILEEARHIARELGVKAELPPRFDLEGPGNRELSINKPGCRVPYNSMYIISDGRVIPCTWFSLKEWCAGDLNTEGFREIWDGEVYRNLRKRWADKTYTGYCRNCPVWGGESMENYVFTEKERKDTLNIFSPVNTGAGK